jgi:triacylglycerol esterase/lipase EstA (alpha/beta hydrolase family)
MNSENPKIIIGIKPQKVKLTENKQEYFKKYYQSHKDKLKEYNDARKMIFEQCPECNCYVVKKHIQTHKRTNKHAKNVLNYNPPNQLENKNQIE